MIVFGFFFGFFCEGGGVVCVPFSLTIDISSNLTSSVECVKVAHLHLKMLVAKVMQAGVGEYSQENGRIISLYISSHFE